MEFKKRDSHNISSGLDYGEPSDAKRIKVDNMDSTYTNNIEPSPVIHCRGLPYTISEHELTSFLSGFGKVVSVCLMKKGQALVEMDSVHSSTAVISYYLSKPLVLQNQKISFSYSKSQHLNNSKKAPAINGANNILLISIFNPLYPITTNTLYTIMSPYGRVLRIVIFQKSGLQAFVEFDSPYSAWTAKENLNGQDIYTGSCKLQIEFARVNKLNVKQNDDKTADYTTEFYSQQMMGGGGGMPPNAGGPNTGGGASIPGSAPFPYHQGGLDKNYPNIAAYMYPPANDPLSNVQQSVIMVQKLPENLDPEKLFNLFCLYGNVVKIKMLHNTKGAAMVQMMDGIQAEIAIQCLNNTNIYGQKLQIFHSKYQFIADSEKTKDYTKSVLNRFTKPSQYGKNAYKPSSTLHFINVPVYFTENQLIDLFKIGGVHEPKQVKFFPTKAESTKIMGLVEFNDTRSAVEALMDMNNFKIEGGGNLKLSFTMNSIHKTDPSAPPTTTTSTATNVLSPTTTTTTTTTSGNAVSPISTTSPTASSKSSNSTSS
ncbi:hypothetical protein CYY_002566 [Polysphondylium violaceum]|uniref:RRM domain-containing protein n=1 Tax=Polysphondylium violaceum TaxID=133409 RepID=A0A8J4Q1E7_9MYCE|nr:hypothetical protein CYY_002566 [Polysphondylium violaceum]